MFLSDQPCVETVTKSLDLLGDFCFKNKFAKSKIVSYICKI